MGKRKLEWKEFRSTMKWVSSLLGVVALYGAAAGIYGSTLVEWWQPLSWALIVALGSWFLLRGLIMRWWQGVNVFLLLFGHMVVVTGVALFLILGLNRWLADDSTIHKETVTVESKLREKHYRSRRVGRNRYTRGEPYYEYYLKVRFANGREKDLHVPQKRYMRTRSGSEIELELETGLWGYPIVNTRL